MFCDQRVNIFLFLYATRTVILHRQLLSFLWALIMHCSAVYKNLVLHLEQDIFSFLFGGWQCKVIFCWEWRSQLLGCMFTGKCSRRHH